ncbi:MAG: exodeoxyribonuclease VII small subunit [Limnobacter sp.]|nr:exodeoxyribonuclease VII small subunit [Limnobacter sp.]
MAQKKSTASQQTDIFQQVEPEHFEAAVAELESLVARMDRPDVGLETLLTDYRRGAYLVKYCRDRLTAVKSEVAKIDQSLMDSEGEGG